MSKSFADREKIDQMQLAYLRLRERQGRFSGLSFQMANLGEKMMADFERAGSVGHPGDRGGAREGQLRAFLVGEGYLPHRFGVSNGTACVVATSGHRSQQMDLVFYDDQSTPKLMDFDNTQYFPCESVYGVLQVKSNIGQKSDVIDALSNLASYKRLDRDLSHGGECYGHGFGGVFACDATLGWESLVEAIEEFESETPRRLWPNFVFVMKHALVGNVVGQHMVFHSSEIEGSEGAPRLWPVPNTLPTLESFYLVLMQLLLAESLAPPPIQEYFLLPHAVGNHWYSFTHPLTEILRCPKHGEYLALFTDQAIEKVFAFCSKAEKIHWLEATDQAYGHRMTTEEQKAKQPHYVRIYNPACRPLSGILVGSPTAFGEEQVKPLAFYDIVIDDLPCWVPFVYAESEGLVHGCPECNRRKKTAPPPESPPA